MRVFKSGNLISCSALLTCFAQAVVVNADKSCRRHIDFSPKVALGRVISVGKKIKRNFTKKVSIYTREADNHADVGTSVHTFGSPSCYPNVMIVI